MSSMLPSARVKPLILIVDHDAQVRTFIRMVLRANDFEVLEASDGCRALRACEQQPGKIALVIMNLCSPGVDGRQLLDLIAPWQAGMRFLYTCCPFDCAFVQNKSDCYLKKPFAGNDLLRSVEAALAKPSPGFQLAPVCIRHTGPTVVLEHFVLIG